MLVDAANDAGGADNITVLVVDVVDVADEEVLEAVPVEADEQDLEEPADADCGDRRPEAPEDGPRPRSWTRRQRSRSGASAGSGSSVGDRNRRAPTVDAGTSSCGSACIAVAITIFGYVPVQLAEESDLPPDLWLFVAVMVGPLRGRAPRGPRARARGATPRCCRSRRC